MLRRLYKEYMEWGLRVYVSKMEYLVINSKRNFKVQINDDAVVEEVEESKYLSPVVDRNDLEREKKKESF